MLIQLLAQAARRQSAAIACGGAHLDELLATSDQLVQREGISRGQCTESWLDGLSEPRDDLGIQAVGLGQAAGRVGEVVYLARIDHHDRQPDGGS
jgi:hypothetical protein